MADLPNLAGVATKDLVEQIGGSFKASYINWSRTLHLLRVHAPGWLPELMQAHDGGVIHTAPIGAFLLIRFRHADGTVTPEVPQAIMDQRNNAIPLDKITARDITDTHRRGTCMAAALIFGLAYELWAKMPLESGYAEDEEEHKAPQVGRPNDGAWEQAESIGWGREKIEHIGITANEYWDAGDVQGAADYLEQQNMPNEAKIAVATMFDSKFRSALKKLHAEQAGDRKKAA